MRHTACLLTTLLLLLPTALRLGAQSTAFAYKGQLLDGGQPANGFYDLRLLLADAPANGSFLGPTLTNALVPVSNGLFTVTLDFGAAVFDGSARWLEIGVRTNAGGLFTVLAPRQQLTTTPYAIFSTSAATAASLSGTLSASQLTGVLSAGQLPGVVNLSGSFTGNVAGGTNLPGTGLQAHTLSSNQMDNATWAALARANLDNYSNVNRYAWSRTASRLRTNAFTTFLIYGSGWAWGNGPSGAMPVTDCYKLLTAYHPESGMVNISGGTFNASSPGMIHDNDSQWPFTYYLLSSPGDSLTSNPYYSDVHEIYYARTALGGTFKIQSSTDGVSYSDVAGFTAVNAARPGSFDIGAVCCWTNNSLANTYLRVVCMAGGRIPILGLGHRNQVLMAAGGVRLATAYETGGPDTSNVQLPIIAPIFQFINPDMCFNIGGQDCCYPWSKLYFMYDLFRTNTPNADVVLCGLFPMTTHASAAPFSTLDQWIVALNGLTSAYCVTNGWAYFDGHTPFGSYDDMVARGLSGGSPTDPHLRTEGYARYNEFLWSWLNLLNTPIGPASAIVYTSPEISLTPSALTLTIPHNLGFVPRLFRAVLRCKSSDAASGLSAGAEIPIEFTSDRAAGGAAYAVAATPTQFIVKGPSGSGNVSVGTTAGNGGATSDLSNFRLVIYATY